MDDETRTKILNRLRSIAGHVRGIEKMVAGDEYCVDIVNQVLAVQRALHKVNAMVLERHMHTCVTKALRSDNPQEQERVIGEILAAFETTGKL